MHSTLVGAPESPLTVWSRIVAVAGLLVVVLGWVLIASPPDRPFVDLSGSWSRDGASTVELPGLFAMQGLPADGRVSVRRRVRTTSAHDAVLLERPQYAVAVLWDGEIVGSAGDPSSLDPDDRSGRVLVVELPPGPPGTEHELALDLRGDFGKGGVTGRMVLGPAADVIHLTNVMELQRLAVVMGLLLLAALPLSVSVAYRRPVSLSYGVLVAALAFVSLTQCDLVHDWLPDPVGVLHMELGASAVLTAVGVLFADSFRTGRTGTRALGFGAAAIAVGAVGLFVPADWLWGVEVVSDALTLVGGLWFGVRVYQAWRDGRAGSWMLVLALAAALWAMSSEISVTHGLRSGASVLGPASALVAMALGVAQALRDADSAAQHERMVRSSLDAMVTVGPDGRIEHANPEAARLLVAAAPGLPPGTTLLMMVAEDQRPLVRAHLERAATRADRCEFTTAHDRVLESLATPLGNGLAMLTLRDITIRREMDRAMLQSARLETAGVLMGGIAHDFNNMLGSVLAHIGLLRLQLTDRSLHSRLDRMESTVEKASELTRRLITVARGTGSQLAPVDLGRVLKMAVELAEPMMPLGVRLVPAWPDALPPILGAASDLEQVLLNLLVNARDAVGPAGTICVDARPFLVRGRLAGVVVMVEDDGPGIPLGRRQAIFEPFVTDKQHGSGLGLAVARQILMDHHGRIWIEDRPPRGTRVLVALRHADVVDEAPAQLPSGRRVLVVDDEPVLLEAQTDALRQSGYDAVGLSSSVEALSWLQQHPLDLLVTDIKMPHHDGLELARRCRVLHPAAPILFVSGLAPESDIQGFEAGTWASLNKPVRSARLVSIVGHLLRRAERAALGAEDVTEVSYSFPSLDGLTGAGVGF